MKTYQANAQDRERDWYVVDAQGNSVQATFTGGVWVGGTWKGGDWESDFVVVVNAEKIVVTGKKLEDKRYWRHSGYPGGIRSQTLGDLLEHRPEEVIRRAVKGMIPRNRLGRQQLRKLKVYAGPEHPHEAQQPKKLEIET